MSVIMRCDKKSGESHYRVLSVETQAREASVGPHALYSEDPAPDSSSSQSESP